MPQPNGAASSAVGRMSTRGLEDSVVSVCRATGCGHPELLAAGVVVLVSVVALLLAGVTLLHLGDAHDAVADERRRAAAERDAFEQFRQRVGRLETNRITPGDHVEPPGGGTLVTGSVADRGGGLRAVRDAYEETVMSTPHHAAEYDETLTESMAAEFSEGVAGTVASGSALTPALYRTLLDGAVEARDRRETVLDRLDTEERRLREAEDVLAPAADAATAGTDIATDDFDGCVATVERLEWHEEGVSDLVAQRQAEIHTETDNPHWYDYVYGDLDATHPVLAAAASVLADLETARDRAIRAAAER
ncbi:hypothetical protein [Halobaculum sp. MBLA0143]|uniref:DUF7260 family protein n=1 Tax=Halobaculum sp. MBLA0143 TaxID=3079933 RepID=UPI0035241FBE